jgi:hypothetical protein
VWRDETVAAFGGGVPLAALTPLRQYYAHAFVACENLLASNVVRIDVDGDKLRIGGLTLTRVAPTTTATRTTASRR